MFGNVGNKFQAICNLCFSIIFVLVLIFSWFSVFCLRPPKRRKKITIVKKSGNVGKSCWRLVSQVFVNKRFCFFCSDVCIETENDNNVLWLGAEKKNKNIELISRLRSMSIMRMFQSQSWWLMTVGKVVTHLLYSIGQIGSGWWCLWLQLRALVKSDKPGDQKAS